MPTYEYVCRHCGEHLEVVQSFTDEPLIQCPHCGGVLKKVFGNIGIVFKGSGFYKTDSRSASRPVTPKADGGDSGGSEKTATGGSSDAGTGSGSKAETSSGSTGRQSSSGSSGDTSPKKISPNGSAKRSGATEPGSPGSNAAAS